MEGYINLLQFTLCIQGKVLHVQDKVQRKSACINNVIGQIMAGLWGAMVVGESLLCTYGQALIMVGKMNTRLPYCSRELTKEKSTQQILI